ncbi:hypothetical protein K432DRAFT_86042 [Lepidopterella palustris CBS 459.81]|uniref:Uncharacterized protein n=1 Tax=Lepidopterella palustris CBS 459.81 TaxID=1314670 RepID=A0A8E2EJ46_9PEZI|nr:hypothetical protein K432DRAFT_86042 [Lepidopterella palustris CBS 459.81]
MRGSSSGYSHVVGAVSCLYARSSGTEDLFESLLRNVCASVERGRSVGCVNRNNPDVPRRREVGQASDAGCTDVQERGRRTVGGTGSCRECALR